MGNITFACELDKRICEHISRGNKRAFEVIGTYHMSEIRQIRNAMMVILRDYFYDARQLNYAFHTAVIDLGINLADLLNPEVKVITPKESSVKKFA